MIGALVGKKALVTGGGRGIGRAIAATFAQAGATVLLAGRKRESLDKAAGEIDWITNRDAATLLVADLTHDAEVARLFEQATADSRPIDILVCNAGINPHRSRGIEDMSVSDWDDVMATNLRSAFLCCRAALPSIRSARSGRIVFVNSIAGHVTPDRNSPAYRASKYGLRSLATTLAKELADTAIRVSSIMPGTVATDMIDPTYAPAGPMLRPHDVADAALFLVTRPDEVVIPEIIISPRYEIGGTSSPYI